MDAHIEEKPEEKEDDFFEAHENFAIPENPIQETKVGVDFPNLLIVKLIT